jgi:hypothetical protein
MVAVYRKAVHIQLKKTIIYLPLLPSVLSLR